jgi:putative transcriptional regulator
MICVLNKSYCVIVKRRVIAVLTLMIFMTLFAFSNARAEGYCCIPDYYSQLNQADIPQGDPFLSSSRLSGGKFLVASRNIKDPRFSESVILLVRYDIGGSMGLIINRPINARLSDALPELKELRNRTDSLYFGGPVSLDQLVVLFQSTSRDEESVRVFDDVFISTSRKVLHGLIVDHRKEERFRAYAGYAGWSSGQLDNEVLRGDWYVLQADSKTIFNKDSSMIWHELIRRISVRWWVEMPGLRWRSPIAEMCPGYRMMSAKPGSIFFC